MCYRAGMSDTIIELHSLTKTFQEGSNERTVFADLNNTFQRGEFVVMLGSSGSGKSTLLNLISGIEEPSSGHVTIDGINVTALSDRDRTLFRRDNTGFIFQFFNLIPTLTVLENVTLPLELAGAKRRDVEPIGRKLLAAVGLDDRSDSYTDKLSGGEQQRVAIARALAHDPALLLADEPTGNLDEQTGDLVLDLLLSLTREQGKTLLMATHSPEIIPHADRVFRMVGGNLLELSGVDLEQVSPA